MTMNSQSAADILTNFIREDRVETRNYRGRVENLTYSITVASFAITAFLTGKSSPLAHLEVLNRVIDAAFILILLALFFRIHRDLTLLRKGMKMRQNLLRSLEEGLIQEIDPFGPVEHVEPDI